MNTEEYFKKIESDVNRAYKVAESCKSKGLDPEKHVEIPLAKDMAERVVGLISVVAPKIKETNIVDRIIELEKKYSAQDWRVALTIALEVAKEKFCKFKDNLEAMEVGIRTGIAYITNGVVSSPIEGFTELRIKKRRDGKEYFALYFSGPIRSAGGTAASVSMLIGDYVRSNMGYYEYDPTEEEINRMVTELYDYHEKITNLQYLPSEEEIRFIVRNLPVQIDGDPSEKYDVSNYKGLDRIETDKIRNGPCLVIGEGICQKAAKIQKNLSNWGKEFGLSYWSFLDDFLKLQKKIKSRIKEEKDKEEKIKPDFTFIKDLVAGRPVFTYPLAKGGFRLRYGRCRNSGFSCQAISPVTMYILNKFIAIGTQLKVERPGKSTAIASCDSVDGPIVKLKNGDVVIPESVDEAKSIANEVLEILFLGDILISHGDFINRNHVLVPAGYCEEWWAKELRLSFEKKFDNLGDEEKGIIESFVNNPFTIKPNVEKAVEIAQKFSVPLHPRYTFRWDNIGKEQLLILIEWYKKGKIENDKIILAVNEKDIFNKDGKNPKRILELIGVPHKCVLNEHVVIEGDWAKTFRFYFENLDLSKEDIFEILSKKITIRNKDGTSIGARMGRPEKAKMRKLTGSPQVLFPVGEQGGRLRSFQEAIKTGYVNGQFPIFFCKKCNIETIYPKCENCESLCNQGYYCIRCGKVSENKCHNIAVTFRQKKIEVKHYFDLAFKKIKDKPMPELVKGVRGTSNKDHTPENFVKGLLRAVYDVYVNKDGTIRYDMTELPLTQFKPKEIGTSIDKLKELGYEKDIYGNELTGEDQLLELKLQDVILPDSEESLEEGAKEILFRIASFIDDLLVYFYNERRFYNLKHKDDIIGHHVVALAPHISAGLLGRVIGFSKTQGFLAHPCFHSALRRDADGDEAGIMLLMDMLLNFSRKYLPDHRGATQDAPLVLTSRIIPKEVDDMVFDLDVVWEYPIELYEAALEYKYPNEVKIEKLRDRLGSGKEYYGYGFTHPVSDINNGVKCSSYKSLPTMEDKVLGQMDLANKIRAVDKTDVARLVIERHFIRDIKGNLRKFSTQQFRCVKCNEKFRRPPIIGKCTHCEGNIIFTVSEGTIIKYLEPSFSLAERYELPEYLKQTLEITRKRIESVFGKEPDKQEGLGKWF